jgi:hypothetical protein
LIAGILQVNFVAPPQTSQVIVFLGPPETNGLTVYKAGKYSSFNVAIQ